MNRKPIAVPRTILVLFLLFALIQNIQFQTVIRLNNNTDKKISASYVLYNRDKQCWISAGWHAIEAYKTLNIPIGDYEGEAYIHGRASGFWSNSLWGRGTMFCVDLDDAFRIFNADKVNCKQRAEFSKVSIRGGVAEFTFNP